MAVGGGGGGGGRAGGILAGQAFVKVSADDSDLKTVLGRARNMVLGVSKTLGGIGAGLVGLGGAALAPILASFQGAVHRMGELKDLSDRFGASTEDLSALGYAAEQTGASLGDVTAAGRFLQRNLIENADEFKALGLNADELRKMGMADQFQAVADAINEIEDPAQQTAAAMKLMGRGGQSMLPMLKELRQLRKRAGLVGAIVDPKDAEAADRIGDALDDLHKAATYTFQSIGATLLDHAGTIEEWVNTVLVALKQVRDWIRKNGELILAVTASAAAVIALGAAFIGIGTALALASVAFSGFLAAGSAVLAVIGAILSPIGLLVIAAGALAVAIVQLLDDMGAFEGMGEGLRVIWGGVLDTFTTTWQGIKDALATGDLKSAFQIAVAGLDVIWKGFLLGLQVAWNDFKGVFVDGWHAMVKGLKDAWIDFVSFFKTATYLAAAEAATALGEGEKAAGFMNRARQATYKGIKDRAQNEATFNRQQGEREAARAGDLSGAIQALIDAKAELAGLAVAAGMARASMLAGNVGMAVFMGMLRQNKGVADAVGGLAGVRGQFGGGSLGSALGVGDQSIPKKQLKEQEEMNDKLGRIEKKVGGLAVE